MTYPHVNEQGKCTSHLNCHPVCGRAYREAQHTILAMFWIIALLLGACVYSIAQQNRAKPPQGTPHALD